MHDLGLIFQDADGYPYWTEGGYFEFTQAEIETIELATVELHHMYLAAVEHVIVHRQYARLGISAELQPAIEAAWEAGAPYIYGRFDLAFDGGGPPKLLEYNADTPTSLLEASVIQWDWMEENRRIGALPADVDQFNAIEDALIAAWRRFAAHTACDPLHLACALDHDEDRQTTEYMRATAAQAGLDTLLIDIRDIGWNAPLQWFVDTANLPIQSLFKLYPWEFMACDAFAPFVRASGVRFIEPAWKLVAQSKAMLAILWELFPEHPYLLPAAFSESAIPGARVKKPLFSREGANIEIVFPDGPNPRTVRTDGAYGAEGHVWQQWTELPVFNGDHAVIGSWVTSGDPRFEELPRHPLGGDPCGLAIREHSGLITGNLSRITPHIFLPDPDDQSGSRTADH